MPQIVRLQFRCIAAEQTGASSARWKLASMSALPSGFRSAEWQQRVGLRSTTVRTQHPEAVSSSMLPKCRPSPTPMNQPSDGLRGRVHRNSAAAIDHKNGIQGLDGQVRLPYRHAERAVERSILAPRTSFARCNMNASSCGCCSSAIAGRSIAKGHVHLRTAGQATDRAYE